MFLDIKINKVIAHIKLNNRANYKNLRKFTDKHFVEDGISYGCSYTDEEINIMQLPRVDEYIQFINGNFIDHLNLQRYHEIDSRIDEQGRNDLSRIVSYLDTKIEFHNEFKLQAFPFDKQQISFKIAGISADQLLVSTDRMEQNLTRFLKSTKIPGWHIIDYNINSGLYQEPGFFTDSYLSSLDVNIFIQRSYQYYIYKIILPILLILLVCWSVLWIPPDELESRLTITVVCLLSLIAYNFVIDDALPKLSYLTIMDYMILTSYLYATIPNFLSIYSYCKYKKNKTNNNRLELIGKRFGLFSYVLIIISIIIFSINNNPYTAEFLKGLI